MLMFFTNYEQNMFLKKGMVRVRVSTMEKQRWLIHSY